MRFSSTASSLLAAVMAVATQAPKLDLSEKALARAASNYVVEYEKQFAFLIADEEYRQTRVDARGQSLESRLLRGEMFMTYLPADREWIAVRDVAEVDGVPVAKREDLRALLSRKDDVRGLIAQMLERNAQYNIGLLSRNFNEPTLPLLLLEPKRIANTKIERKRVEDNGGVTLVTLAFEERDRPTLVAGKGLGSLTAKGEFLIEGASGAIRRTLFQIKRSGVDVRLETTYEKHEKLGLWLPSVFTERYVAGTLPTLTSPRSRREQIECEARYTNYRRFEVTAKIK